MFAFLPISAALPVFALLQVRGDWEWLQQAFRFRHHGNESFCWQCAATKTGEMCFHDFSLDAPHRNTLMTHSDYLASLVAEEAEPSNLWRSPGLLLQHVAVDVMHSGDLGCFQDAIGGLFWLECSCKSWHRTIAAGLAELNRELGYFYSANPGKTKATPIVWTQIKSADPPYPTFKARRGAS